MEKIKNRKTTALSNEKGITLIELLIAMAILAVGMFGMVTMQIASSKGNRTGNMRTEARILAQSMIEQLSEQDATALTIGSLPVEANIDVNGATGGIYTRTTTIDNMALDNGSNSGVARIVTVTVSWGSKAMSITSYIIGDGA